MTASPGVADGADRSPPVPVLKPLAAAQVVRSEDQVAPLPTDLLVLDEEASENVANRSLVMLDSVLEKLGLTWEAVRSATAVQPVPALARSPYDRGFDADGEIRLAIGLSEGLSVGPAYGLHLQRDELRREERDLDHQFKLGARFNF